MCRLRKQGVSPCSEIAARGAPIPSCQKFASALQESVKELVH